MKITRIETFPVFNGARNNLFVTVDTDEGISGVGESGLSNRELAVIGAVEHFKPLLIGQDATRIEHIWQTLFRGGSGARRHQAPGVEQLGLQAPERLPAVQAAEVLDPVPVVSPLRQRQLWVGDFLVLV